MKVTLLDTKTGEVSTPDDQFRSWVWTDGNWSCDCNRVMYFDDENGTIEHEMMDELGLEGGICLGCHRFLVIAAERNMDHDYTTTLKELNDGYPMELLERVAGERGLDLHKLIK